MCVILCNTISFISKIVILSDNVGLRVASLCEDKETFLEVHFRTGYINSKSPDNGFP